MFFFLKQKTAYEMRISDWSSDVCSSDLLRRGRGDDDRIFHRAIFFELTHDLRDGRALLADGDVDAIELLALIGALVGFALVDEGVDRDRGLAGLAVADKDRKSVV